LRLQFQQRSDPQPSSVTEALSDVAGSPLEAGALGENLVPCVESAGGPGYVQLPAVRGYLLARLGRSAGPRAEFSRAAALTSNARERALFRVRCRM
jgi:predicted RNA polymerase sigma factor